MLAFLLVIAVFGSVIAPAIVLGIVKDGTPLRRDWWTA